MTYHRSTIRPIQAGTVVIYQVIFLWLHTRLCRAASHLLVAQSATSERLKMHRMQNWQQEDSPESQKYADHVNSSFSFNMYVYMSVRDDLQ